MQQGLLCIYLLGMVIVVFGVVLALIVFLFIVNVYLIFVSFQELSLNMYDI